MKKKLYFVLFILIFQSFFATSCQIEIAHSLFNTSSQTDALFFSSNDTGGFGTLTGNLQVGFGSRTIYPSNPVSLTGFGSPLRRLLPPDIVNAGNGATYCKPYQSIDKEPRVKSMLFKGTNNNTDGYYLIVSIDVVAIPIDFNLKVLKMLQQNFPNQNFTHATVQFIATHTHSGPAGLAENPFWAIAVCDSFNSNIYDIVSAQIIAAVSDSLGNLNSIQTIDSANAQIPGYNFTRFAGMDVDTSAFYINFKDINSNSMGCFQVFSGHPTWYGMSDLTFSSDFAGYVENRLQSQTGANTCIFLNATVGNATVTSPPDKNIFVQNFVKDVIAKTTLNQAAPTSLGYGTVFITLPGFQINYSGCGINLGFIPQSFFQSVFSIKSSDITNNITKISWFSIAGTYFFMFPGEPLYDTKLAMQSLLAQQFPNINSFYVLSTANDYVGYLMTSSNYSTQNIDTCSTLHGPDTSATIINGFLSGLHQSGQ
jgi:Neutral/alkaline non-lysosomal ceramidase, N-terminal